MSATAEPFDLAPPPPREPGAGEPLAPARAAPPTLVLQLVRYALVGATNTAVTLAAYTLLVAAGAPAPLAAALGWGVGALNGYLLNRRWTFRSGLRGARPAVRYATVAALAAGLDAIGVAVLVGRDHLPHLTGEIAILPAVTLLTFVLCRRWVFGRPVTA
jgi:putative flippase GtrA